jgi:alpha-beta hydrolase superfamily lysophospholipase
MELLAGQGVACYALDFRGQGRSSGPRGFVRRWDEYLDDLTRFTESIAAGQGASAPPVLFALGHSHGALVLAAAVERLRTGFAGCILTAPFFRPRLHVPRHKKVVARLADPVLPFLPVPTGLCDEWMSRDPAMVADSRRDPFIVRTATPRWFLGCSAAQDRVLAEAKSFSLPLLVLMGDADRVADPVAAADFVELAGSLDKRLIRIPEGLHEVLRDINREAMVGEIVSWMRLRVDERPVALAG